MRSPGMPRRVLLLAMTMGAHGDCLVASYESCCSVCRTMVDTAFDVTYLADASNHTLGDVLDSIFQDMASDGTHD